MDSTVCHEDADCPALLLSAAQMQAVDARAVEQGLDSFGLMGEAGKAVCQAALELLPARTGSILVVAGPGNNGGDGAVAATALREHGHAVTLLRLLPESARQVPVASASLRPSSPSDAERAFDQWQGETMDCYLDEQQLQPRLLELFEQVDVIVDALFGAGLSRPLEGLLSSLVDKINSSPARVLAVDVPSGLDGNTHQVHGACVQADATVTFFLFKPAHFLYPGRALCGRKTLAQIGLSEQQLDPDWPSCRLNQPASFVAALPSLSSEGHKFDRGHVLVRSGPMQSTGAARLAAQTALNCGAGLVTVASDQEALPVNAAHLTAVMNQPCDELSQWQDLLQDPRINMVLLGPGNGVDKNTADCVLAALGSGKRCVLDADALSCWPQTEDLQRLYRQLAAAGKTAVLTPHAGEFDRLFPELPDASTPGSSRLHRALQAAALSAAVLVFKGADTVIAAPDGRSAINANAPPWLATAGAGDVLAGIIASLMAQGMETFEAACAAVWLHGQAASEIGYPLCAEKLVSQVPEVLRGISPINQWPGY